MKYIIFSDGGHPTYPVLFPGNINHAALARKIGEPVHSAGFCEFADGKVRCFDGSQSLGVNAKPGDADIIDVWMNIK